MRRVQRFFAFVVAVLVFSSLSSLCDAQSNPSITSISPNPAGVGMVVTITGTNLGSSGTVTFNGTAASPTMWTSTTITTPVPAGATTGNVVVTSGGQASNGFSFTVNNGPINYTYDDLGRLVGVVDSLGNGAIYSYDAVGNILGISRISPNQVAIIDFTPTSGPAGATVTINGSGFSSNTAQNTIQFNGTTASIISSSPTQLVTTVPSGASSGPITVTSPNGSATSSSSFTVSSGTLAPSITGFTPTVATSGTAITVTGTNFDPTPGNNSLRLNLSRQVISSVTGSTSLATSVPSYTASGRLSIANAGGSATSTSDFFVPFGTHVPGDIAVSTRILVGGATTVALTASKAAEVLFDGTSGQRVSVQTSSNTMSSCVIYLFDPYGNQLASGGCSGSSSSFASPDLSYTGTYTVGVDGVGGSGGSFSLSVIDASDVTGTITAGGSPVTVTTTKSGQDARLTFAGSAGQRVSLGVPANTVTNPYAYLWLVRPDGGIQGLQTPIYANSGGTFFMDTQTLLSTGSYQLWVQHNLAYFGSETLQLYNVPADFSGFTTLGGSPVTVTTTVPGQNGSLTFGGTAGQKVSMSLTSGTYPTNNCALTLINPSGGTVTTGACGGATGFVDTAALSTTGTYTVSLNPLGVYTGSVAVQLNNVSDVTGTITAGGSPVTVTTTVPGQDARLTFSASAGARVSVNISNITNPYATLVLLKPDGTSQTSLTFNSPGPYFLDVQTLGTSGTYTLWVQHSGAGVGSETLQLYSVPADFSGTITPGGSAVTVTTTVPGQNGSLSFSGTAGQKVSESLSSGTYPSSSCALTVQNPNGSTVTTGGCGGATGYLDTATLQTNGTYALFVNPSQAAVGSVTIQLNNVPDITGTIPTDGTATTVTMAAPGQDARLTFSGTSGQRISLLVNTITNPYAFVYILKPDSSSLAEVTINNSGSAFFIDVQTLPTTGTYTVWVQHSSSNLGNETLHLYNTQDITGTITPNGASDPETITIPGQRALLTFSGTSGQTATVQVTGNAIGSVTLSILNPNGSTLTSTSSTASSFSLGPATLSTTGTYTVDVDPNGSLTGSITVSLTTH